MKISKKWWFACMSRSVGGWNRNEHKSLGYLIYNFKPESMDQKSNMYLCTREFKRYISIRSLLRLISVMEGKSVGLEHVTRIWFSRTTGLQTSFGGPAKWHHLWRQSLTSNNGSPELPDTRPIPRPTAALLDYQYVNYCNKSIGRWAPPISRSVDVFCLQPRNCVINGGNNPRTVGQNQLVLKHPIMHFPTNSGVREWASERTKERSGARDKASST